MHHRGAGSDARPLHRQEKGTEQMSVWELSVIAARKLRPLIAGACLVVVVAIAGCQPAPNADVPEGSLRLLAEAAEDSDWDSVRTYMDPDAVGVAFGESLIVRLRSDDVPDASSPDSGSHGGEFSSGPMVGGFTSQFVEALEAGVEDGAVVGEGKLFTAILDDGVGETESVSEDEALVTVTVPAESGEVTVRLRMTRNGDHWTLIAVEDTTDLYGLFFNPL